MVIAKMKSGYAVIGDTQFLPGYCVLLAYPKVDTLNDLTIEQRGDYLVDMSLIGDAIQSVCNPRRLNYSMYGNSDAFCTHIFFLAMSGNLKIRNLIQFGSMVTYGIGQSCNTVKINTVS